MGRIHPVTTAKRVVSWSQAMISAFIDHIIVFSFAITFAMITRVKEVPVETRDRLTDVVLPRRIKPVMARAGYMPYFPPAKDPALQLPAASSPRSPKPSSPTKSVDRHHQFLPLTYDRDDDFNVPDTASETLFDSGSIHDLDHPSSDDPKALRPLSIVSDAKVDSAEADSKREEKLREAEEAARLIVSRAQKLADSMIASAAALHDTWVQDAHKQYSNIVSKARKDVDDLTAQAEELRTTLRKKQEESREDYTQTENGDVKTSDEVTQTDNGDAEGGEEKKPDTAESAMQTDEVGETKIEMVPADTQTEDEQQPLSLSRIRSSAISPTPTPPPPATSEKPPILEKKPRTPEQPATQNEGSVESLQISPVASPAYAARSTQQALTPPTPPSSSRPQTATAPSTESSPLGRFSSFNRKSRPQSMDMIETLASLSPAGRPSSERSKTARSVSEKFFSSDKKKDKEGKRGMMRDFVDKTNKLFHNPHSSSSSTQGEVTQGGLVSVARTTSTNKLKKARNTKESEAV